MAKCTFLRLLFGCISLVPGLPVGPWGPCSGRRRGAVVVFFGLRPGRRCGAVVVFFSPAGVGPWDPNGLGQSWHSIIPAIRSPYMLHL